MGIIRLKNMTFFAHHGALVAERELGQQFQVDVEMTTDLSRAAASDDVADTVDYAEVHRLVKEVIMEREYHLLEALAQAILDAIARRYRLDGLCVRVRKPHPPFPIRLDSVEVELSEN